MNTIIFFLRNENKLEARKQNYFSCFHFIMTYGMKWKKHTSFILKEKLNFNIFIQYLNFLLQNSKCLKSSLSASSICRIHVFHTNEYMHWKSKENIEIQENNSTFKCQNTCMLITIQWIELENTETKWHLAFEDIFLCSFGVNT